MKQSTANKLSFWLFPGKWAIIFAVAGIFLIVTGEEPLIGTITFVASVLYLAYKIRKMKKESQTA